MDKKSVLEQFSFYRQAGAAVRENMLGRAQLTSLPERAMYLTDGDETDVIALVGAGRLRVYKTSESGREITLYEVKAGEFCVLNLLCMLTGIRAPASARVEESVHAVIFQGADFRRWIGSDPAIRAHVFALLGRSVADIMGLVEEIAFKKMDVRLAEYLQTKLRGTDSAIVETTHEMIALDLGSAREVISRLLKEFERQGAVHLARGRITVNDTGLLKSLAGDA
jgi:CRP/FNR family transcriptional regulator